MTHFDAIVVGVGGMGSSAVYHLAQRGLKVLGLDRYDIPNEMGSSHGLTRMIRLAYHEDPSYIPIMQRAYELWHQLENHTGERLLYTTGSIRGGTEDGSMFTGSKEACDIHHLPYEVLDGPEINKRFPGYQLPEDALAIYQPDGGFLLSERCIVAYLAASLEIGAEVHGREQVLGWEPLGDGVRVNTDKDTYTANSLVISAGSWAYKFLPDLAPYAVPERQVLGWFQPSQPKLFQPGAFPVWGLEFEEGRFYGFPSHGVPGFKIGRYNHLYEQVDPDDMDREPNARDEEVLKEFTTRYFPEAAGPTLALKTCLFTNTPDEHFILDRLPDYPQVSIAAGFSGHGFKFCSVVGEIMADLSQHGETRHDLSLFKLDRFANYGA